jgi:3-polyprenyl-4-hydroxybenzoate decarboxylase
MPVVALDPSASPPGITDKLVIDATTPVSPDARGHFDQPVTDRPETGEWVRRLTAMLSDRANGATRG